MVVIDALKIIYVMKQVSIGTPDHYLGANIEKVKTQDIKVMWSTHSGYCCKAEIANLDNTMLAGGKSLSQYRDGRCPYPSSLHPDIDNSTDLDEKNFHEYQQHICVLHSVIELRIIDIMTELSFFFAALVFSPGKPFESGI